MPNENMYNAEKTLCNSTLIEIEKLNDVEGIGRKAKKRPAPEAPPASAPASTAQQAFEFQHGWRA